jgi:hypothetical protein
MDARAALQSSYIKSADLQGHSVRVTVRGSQMETVGQGKEAEEKLVLYFAGKEKGMVLNATNINVLGQLTGSFETNDWIGWRFTLCVRKVDFQGRRVDGLRIDDAPGSYGPPAQPVQAAAYGHGQQFAPAPQQPQMWGAQPNAPAPAQPAPPAGWDNYGPMGSPTLPVNTGTGTAITDDDIPF